MLKRYCSSCNFEKEHISLYKKNESLIRKCRACGLGSAEQGDFDPEGYYTEDYFNGGHSDGYADYAGSEQVLRNEFSRLVASLKKYFPNGGKLLEIGSAYGFFLKEAQSLFEVHGIELVKDAVIASRKAGLKNVRQGVADEKALNEVGMVDVIVLLDVIEHLPSPVDTLRHCRSILKPGGVILITTGDFDSIASRITKSRWRLMTPPQHLWFFTKKSFENISENLNFDMVEYRKPWKIVPLPLMVYQLARMFGLRFRFKQGTFWGKVGIPINMFDAMLVVLKKPGR